MFKRKFKSRGQRPGKNELIHGSSWVPGDIPEKEKVSEDGMLFNTKAYRDLQNVGNIEVTANPNEDASKTGYPYWIINKQNRVIDAKYPGKTNITGNSLTRMANGVSKLLNSYDVLTVNFRINYLYACYKTSETTKHNNVAVNRELTKTCYEALSKAYSTMTTQLPYYTCTVEAPDMPTISGLSEEESDVYMKMTGLLHYQTVIQNAMSPLSKYIETISLEQTALDMSYRREAPLVCSLYGLLKKAAFKSTLNSIGTVILGEYFDENWYKQMNALAFIPSRRSKSMKDPLMTATCTTCIPRIKIKAQGAETYYYDSNNIKSVAGIYINPDTFEFEGTTEHPVSLKFEDIVYRINRMMDVSTILRWARLLNNDATQVGSLTSPSAYYQQIVKLLEQLNTALTSFTTKMTDIRTLIDKLQESKMVYWRKNMAIKIDKIEQYEPMYNIALNDMVAAYVGGSSEMYFDEDTQRWGFTTLWNMYEGVANFDFTSGGCFLTFGLRKLNLGNLNPLDSAMCIPIQFASELESGYSKCIITNRLGLTHTLTSDESANVLQNQVLARLDPLSVGFKVKVPYVDISSLSLNAAEKANVSSAILSLMARSFGYGKVKTAAGVEPTVCDPDYIAFIDYQLEDVSNEMIQYCRNYSPFRVSTPDGKRTIGFGQ